MDFWQKLVIYIFLIEIAIITFFVIFTLFHRLFLIYKQKKDSLSRKEISNIFIASLQGNKDLLTTLSRYDKQSLLNTLETFNNYISDQEWESLKNKINETYLLPLARKEVFNSSWIKRNYAVRCFVLTPLEKDEKKILQLTKDPIFLVCSVAAIATVRLEKKEGVIEIIKQMSQKKGYARYFYQDLLLKGSRKIYDWIKEVAEKDKDKSIHLACLELLGNTSFFPIPKYLEEDLVSEDSNMRLAAIKIIARNPQEGTLPLLLQRLQDNNPAIREEAISGLQYFSSPELFGPLEIALEDNEWLVRLQAAKTLKKMGAKGLSILQRSPSYDVAKVVLEEGAFNA